MEQTFDTGRPISIRLRSAQGEKLVTVRFPTDAEWMERQRHRKVIIKQLGRGMSETTIQSSEEFDGSLVAKLRTEADGTEIDPFEATYILNELSQADVDDVSQEGSAFRVTIRVPGVMVEHLVAMPTARDVTQYRRGAARVIDLPYNRQRIDVNLTAAAELYARIKQETKGYAASVPIIHQAVVISAVVEALESGLGVADPANF